MKARQQDPWASEIVVFGDVHYAAYWDTVAEVFSQRPDVLNPNAEFARFLSCVSSRHRDAALVNLGDAVDYFFASYGPGAAEAQDNRSLFYAMLDAEEIVCDEVLGNHDYRLHPYNLRYWGLEQINISDPDRRALVDRLGHSYFRGAMTELRALGRLGADIDPLQNYRGFRAPAVAQRGSYNCIFLNTQADLFSGPIGAWHAARHLLRAGFASRAEPLDSLRGMSIPCKGLSEADFEFIETTLRGCADQTTIIFMHAPLVNPRKVVTGKSVKLRLNELHKQFAQEELAHHSIAYGAAGLLKMLTAEVLARQNVVMITGHAHRAGYILIDKKSLVMRQVDLHTLNKSWHDEDYIKHIAILPIGSLELQLGADRTGYGLVGVHGFSEVTLSVFGKNCERPQAKEVLPELVG